MVDAPRMRLAGWFAGLTPEVVHSSLRTGRRRGSRRSRAEIAGRSSGGALSSIPAPCRSSAFMARRRVAEGSFPRAARRAYGTATARSLKGRRFAA